MLPDAAIIKRRTANAALDSYRRSVHTRAGARDQLKRTLEAERGRYASLREDAVTNQEAQIFMLSEVNSRRQEAITLIEEMATAALQRIYGGDYRLMFTSNESERKEGKAVNFQMRLNIVSSYRGKELQTGLVGEVGGGLIEAVAFALRIAFLSVMGWNGPIILDEAYSAMSTDGKLKALAEFLHETCELTGRQIIFVTHAGAGFKHVADRILRVEKSADGSSIVSTITADDLARAPAWVDGAEDIT